MSIYDFHKIFKTSDLWTVFHFESYRLKLGQVKTRLLAEVLQNYISMTYTIYNNSMTYRMQSTDQMLIVLFICPLKSNFIKIYFKFSLKRFEHWNSHADKHNSIIDY